MPIAPSPPVASTNGSVAAVSDAGLAAAYTGTRSAGPLAGVTMTRPEASLSHCRGRLSRGAATAVCVSVTVRSCVFGIAAALASSWTRNVRLLPAGTDSEVPSGNEYETPGIAVRLSNESVYVWVDEPRLCTRIVFVRVSAPATSMAPNETLTAPAPSSLSAIELLASAAGMSTRPEPTLPTPNLSRLAELAEDVVRPRCSWPAPSAPRPSTSGCAGLRSAMTPAMCGEAMDVPFRLPAAVPAPRVGPTRSSDRGPRCPA